MKRLVVCSDGTWNKPHQKDRGVLSPTNVVKVARAVVPSDPRGAAQVVFYDPGVGTGNWLDRLTGGAFGSGLSRNVRDNYRFLVHNYSPGDQVFLFGFSRGAFTARSTAGLIRNCGLLRKEHAHRIEEAYELYRSRETKPDDGDSVRFRRDYSHEVPVRFIGVWDTVGALGIPVSFLRRFTKSRYEFHDVRLSSHVQFAYHALAIDERRKHFRPTLWKTRPDAVQEVEQVWFAGVHANVGGGYQGTGLSDIALLWMIEKAKRAGLAFDDLWLARNTCPDPVGELRDSRRGLFKFMGTIWRSIGRQSCGQEALDPTALERRRVVSAYRPPNLEDYLRRHGVPDATTQLERAGQETTPDEMRKQDTKSREPTLHETTRT